MNYTDYDKNDMYDVLKNTYRQIEHIKHMLLNKEKYVLNKQIDEIVITGMGGSAIGGDLIRSFLNSTESEMPLRITVSRGYDIPKFVNKNTLVIVSSYSGNTEETLSSFYQAQERTSNIVAITSGGILTEEAYKNGLYKIELPEGFQPRCALGYSFFAILQFILNSNILDKQSSEFISNSIDETLELLKKRSEEYSLRIYDNPAYDIADKISNKIPVIYSASERLDIVNLRWRGQFHENSKSLAFGNFLPEMNHNEINGWEMPDDLLNRFIIVLLKDNEDNERIKLRMDAISQIFNEKGIDIITLKGAGNSLLTRIFDLIYLGDWISFYLAEQYNQDPMSIPLIMKLKEILGRD
jgi:glucose/mannose-6-phosphate isomerase